jgi:ribonuclease BN (tRNA processing enzyme)
MKKNALTIKILGSGTCVPSLKRCSCSVFVEINGAKLLFDAGPGVMIRLLETGASIFDISHIFLSHFHPDHCADLVPFLFATKYPDASKRKKTLRVIAGSGFKSFYRHLQRAYGDWMEPAPGFMEIIEMDNQRLDSLKFDEFTLGSAPVNHREESVAFKISHPSGKSMVYSGDTDISHNLVQLSKNTDILICESALPDGCKVQGHLTPSLAGEMAARAGVKMLVLTHLYPECDRVDIKKECQTTWDGPILIAKDFMELAL